MGIYANDVQKLYIAYFNRPADVVGLAYWEEQITNNGGSTAAVANAFSASAEYKALYDGKSSAQIVEAIYQNLFGRAAETDGLIYWATRLENGTFNVGNIAVSILVGAQNDDKKVIDNKTTAAVAFTTAMDTSAEIIAYSGTAAAAVARTWLATVGATEASLTAATASVASTITSITSGTVANGLTVTLTDDIADSAGSANNDTFKGTVNADDSTYQTGDFISGGAGTDTLEILVTDDDGGALDPLVETTGVEVVKLRSLDATYVLNASSFDGVTEIWSNRSGAAAAADGVSAQVTVGVLDTDEDFTVTYDDDALDSDDATQTLSVNGADDVVITVNGGGADVITGLTVIANGDDSEIDFASDIDALETLTVSGDAALELNESADAFDNLTTVDASANSGGVTITFDDETALESIKGSSGDDVITLGGTTAIAAEGTIDLGAGDDVLAAAQGSLDDVDSVDGGAGTDAISLDAMVVANASKFSNFETADLAGAAGTIDVSLFTKNTFSSLLLTGALGGNTTVQNLAGTSINLAVQDSSGGTITALLKTSSGTDDSATIAFDEDSTGFVVDAFTSTGLETLNITSDGDETGVNEVTALVHNSNTLTKVVISGANDLVIGDVDTNATATAGVATSTAAVLTSIDGSAATGDLDITAGASATVGNVTTTYNGLTIKTGSGDDVVANAALLGVVETGEGADAVTVDAAGQTIRVGADEDVDNVVIADGAAFTTAAAAMTASSRFTTIEQLGEGDTIDLSAYSAAAATVVDYTEDAEAFNSLVDAVNGAIAAGGEGDVTAFEWADGNTYIVVEGTTAANTDVVIKLVGSISAADLTADGAGVVTIG